MMSVSSQRAQTLTCANSPSQMPCLWLAFGAQALKAGMSP